MTAADCEDFYMRLACVAELFDAAITQGKAELYFDALKDLPIIEVIAAMNAAVKLCTFMPKPAELRRLAVGDDDDHAERAWLAMKAAMRSIGAYGSLVTIDPALGETILAMFGSWPAACESDFSPEMWSSKRKEFGRVFHIFRGDGLQGIRRLAGLNQDSGRELDRFMDVAVIERDGAMHRLRGDKVEDYLAATAAIVALSDASTSDRRLPNGNAA
jgi:hypothetical protein